MNDLSIAPRSAVAVRLLEIGVGRIRAIAIVPNWADVIPAIAVAIDIHQRRGIPMSVVLPILGAVGVEVREVAAGGGQLHAAGSAVDVPITDETGREKTLLLNIRIPSFAHQPVGAVLTSVIAAVE